MPEIDQSEISAALAEAGLADAGNGVVFPWGFTIAQVDGVKMLRPLTPNEYKALVESETGKPLSQDEVDDPRCVNTPGACRPLNGRCQETGCRTFGSGGKWWCHCDFPK